MNAIKAERKRLADEARNLRLKSYNADLPYDERHSLTEQAETIEARIQEIDAQRMAAAMAQYKATGTAPGLSRRINTYDD